MGVTPAWRRAARPALAAALAAALGVLLVADAPPALLWVVFPTEGDVVGAGGVEVMVRFHERGRAAEATFRALLNGADVTSEFTTASNGAYGRLHGLLDGENLLRVEVFGERGSVLRALVAESREVRFLVRPPQDINRG